MPDRKLTTYPNLPLADRVACLARQARGWLHTALIVTMLYGYFGPLIGYAQGTTGMGNPGRLTDQAPEPPQPKKEVLDRAGITQETIRQFIERTKNQGMRAMIMLDKETGGLLQALVVSREGEVKNLEISKDGRVALGDVVEGQSPPPTAERVSSDTTVTMDPEMRLIVRGGIKHAVVASNPDFRPGTGYSSVDLVEPYGAPQPNMITFWTYAGANMYYWDEVRNYQGLPLGHYHVTRIDTRETPFAQGYVTPVDMRVGAEAFSEGTQEYQLAWSMLLVDSDMHLYLNDPGLTTVPIAGHSQFFPIIGAGSN